LALAEAGRRLAGLASTVLAATALRTTALTDVRAFFRARTALWTKGFALRAPPEVFFFATAGQLVVRRGFAMNLLLKQSLLTDVFYTWRAALR
jgi:hypothetical protein